MLKRAFWLGVLLAFTQLATGCCYYGGWCHRPYLFPRPWAACYGPTCGGDCCGGAAAYAPAGFDYGQPPLAPTGPTMPRSTDLSRR